jgi:cytochrome P450
MNPFLMNPFLMNPFSMNPFMINRQVTLGPYTIPAGTYVAPLHTAIFMDEKKFPDPERFNPNRLHDKNDTCQPMESLKYIL